MIGQLHHQLKEATAPIHRRLDAHSILTPLTGLDLDIERYQQIMVQHWWAYRCWQPQLDRAFPATRLGKPWQIDLALDKLSLDCADQLKTSVRLTAPEPAPLTVEGSAEYLGCAYVFEGSRLGGRYIYKALQSRRAHLGVDRFHYYETLAQNTSVAWPAWVQQLEAYAVANDLAFEQIVSGAVACFEVLTDWFKQPQVAPSRTIQTVL
ncbi:biliverdin-producing heme oxygenase [Marinobacter sediminum]|uniref:biliverdin-producing heme oxygenase n=1 Tax=Marinobacter sediminum TaxID=256323 RepID=UPI001939D84F|nr:biliverdin-producing heme oxygenase [Marinobacter sediminum]